MIKVVCFGDSITARKEGYSAPILTYKLSAKLPGYQFINAGISGNTTVEAKERLEQDVLKKKPDIVTVLFGANDSAAHRLVDINEFKENLRSFAEQIGPSKTIFISPAPVDESLQPNRSNERIQDYARAVEVISRETGSQYIDFFTEFYSKENYKALLKGKDNDGLHFGEAGYNLLSGLIAQKLLELKEIKPSFFKRIFKRF